MNKVDKLFNKPVVSLPTEVNQAWVISSIEEANGEYVPKQIMVDYNNDCNIYFAMKNVKGGLYSPTLALNNLIKTTMQNHMNSYEQHKLATKDNSGFISGKDRQNLDELYLIKDSLINDGFIGNSYFKRLYPNGLIDGISFSESEEFIEVKEYSILFNGYYITIPSYSIQKPQRPETGRNLYVIYISLTQIATGCGSADFKPAYIMKPVDENIDIESLYDPTSSDLPVLFLERRNSSTISSDNPFGIATSFTLYNETQSIANHILLNDFSLLNIIREVGENYQKYKYYNCLKQVFPIYYGIPTHTIDNNTLVYIDTRESIVKDAISGALMDKSTLLTLSPSGFDLYQSTKPGILLPLRNGVNLGGFSVNFNIKPNNIYEESLIQLLNVKSSPVIDINIRQGMIYINELLVEYKLSDYSLLTIVFENQTVKVYDRNNLVFQSSFNYNPNIIKQFSIPVLNTQIGDIRLQNNTLLDDIYGKDIIDGYALYAPPINIGYKQLNNDVTSIFMKEECKSATQTNGFYWNKNSSFTINNCLNEYIGGILNPENSIGIIQGINNDSDIKTNITQEIQIGDILQIAKPSGLYHLMKVLDYNDGVLTMMKFDKYSTNITKFNFNLDFIGAYIYPINVTPDINVLDGNGKMVSVSQSIDSDFNLNVILNENVNTPELEVSYLLFTDYGEVIPPMSEVNDVSVNGIPYIFNSQNGESINIPLEYVSIKGGNLTKAGEYYYSESPTDFSIALNLSTVENYQQVERFLNDTKVTISYYTNDKLDVTTTYDQHVTLTSETNMVKPVQLTTYNINNSMASNGEIEFNFKVNNSSKLLFKINSIEIDMELSGEDYILSPANSTSLNLDELLFIGRNTNYIGMLNTSNEVRSIKLYSISNKMSSQMPQLSSLNKISVPISLSNNTSATLYTDDKYNAYLLINGVEEVLIRMPKRLVVKGGIDCYANFI